MLRDIIAKRERELPVSTIGKLLEIAEEKKEYLSLGPGEPDFAAPKNVINVAIKKLKQGYTHYSPPEGIMELKQEIVKKLRMDNKIKAGQENVIVTTGSTEGILLTLMATIDPGEGVLIPDPGFLAYKPVIEVLNGIPISVPLHEKDGFEYDTDRMKELIIPEKTKSIILNSPANPTGTVLNKKNLEEIADFAVEHNLLIISDEAYERFVYEDARHVSIGSLNGLENRVITLFSFSKAYAMPGFRVGYAVGPESVISAMKKLHIFTTICAPTISQLAALEALRGSGKYVKIMLKEYDKRRKYIVKRLNEIDGINCRKPEGAFYTFPNITAFKMSSLKFSEWLLEKAKVVVVPGTEFGRHGEGYIRCSYATALPKIKIALDRMEKALKTFNIGEREIPRSLEVG